MSRAVAPESSLFAYVHTKLSMGARMRPEDSLFAYAHAKSSNGAVSDSWSN